MRKPEILEFYDINKLNKIFGNKTNLIRIFRIFLVFSCVKNQTIEQRCSNKLLVTSIFSKSQIKCKPKYC
jgi:hypothetical protein